MGPDGKPWHSLARALAAIPRAPGPVRPVRLLAALGHRQNLRLLDKIPAVYHDPIYGDQPGQFTHYAAVAGSSWLIPTAFPVSGMEMKDVTILPLKRLSEQDVSRDGNGELRVQKLANPEIRAIKLSADRILNKLCSTTSTIVVAGVVPDRKNPLDEA